MKFIAALLVLSLCALPSALAWGDTGHELIASVADSLITANCSDCASDIADILGSQTMEDVSTWADKVRSEKTWKWTAPLHYIDTPDWECAFTYDSDCPNDMCVAGALHNFTGQINDGARNSINWQLDSLKFVIHFVGDIHQPLHVAFASDKGGNDITGSFEGDSGNLHSVWDTSIIDKRISDDFNGDQDQYAAWILDQIQNNWTTAAAEWAGCPSGELECSDDWATETGGIACTNAYKDQDGNVIADGYDLGDPYYYFNQPVVDQQLAKAAVRLSATLQRVFASSRALRANKPSTDQPPLASN